MGRLGELEAQLMDVLWAAVAPMSTREVLEALPSERRRAYTTVMTVLDNLHGKGLVARERRGRAWVYRAARSREDHVASLVDDVLGEGDGRRAALLHFVDGLTAEEAALLRRRLGDLLD